jgi:hypothetical protein
VSLQLSPTGDISAAQLFDSSAAFDGLSTEGAAFRTGPPQCR